MENEDTKLKDAVINFFNTYDTYEDTGNRIESLKEQLKENEERLRNLETKLSNVSEIMIGNSIPEKSIVEHRQKRYVFDLDIKGLNGNPQIADTIGKAKFFKRYVVADLTHF